jgi:hypothetical protein
MTWASDGFYRSGTKSETCAPRCAVTAAIEPRPVRRLEVLTASTEGDLEAVFTTMIRRQVGALIVIASCG